MIKKSYRHKHSTRDLEQNGSKRMRGSVVVQPHVKAPALGKQQGLTMGGEGGNPDHQG